jgi:hypothetical protein
MNAPSKQRLIEALGLTAEQADLIRALIHKTVKTWDPALFPETAEWVRQCYHRPPYVERLLSAINETMQGHGVEHIGENALYVNTGDTYSPTLLYDYSTGTIRLTTWGDFVETH